MKEHDIIDGDCFFTKYGTFVMFLDGNIIYIYMTINNFSNKSGLFSTPLSGKASSRIFMEQKYKWEYLGNIFEDQEVSDRCVIPEHLITNVTKLEDGVDIVEYVESLDYAPLEPLFIVLKEFLTKTRLFIYKLLIKLRELFKSLRR